MCRIGKTWHGAKRDAGHIDRAVRPLRFSHLAARTDGRPGAPAHGDARAVPRPIAPAELDYRIITDWAAFDAWMALVEDAPLVALDTETTSLDEMQARLVGLSMAVKAGRGLLYPGGAPWPRGGRSIAQGRGHRAPARLAGGRGRAKLCTMPNTIPMSSPTKE